MARQPSRVLPMVTHRQDSGIILCQNVKVRDACRLTFCFNAMLLSCLHDLNPPAVLVQLIKMSNSYVYVNFSLAITCPSLPVPTNGVKTGCTDVVSEPYDKHCSFSCKDGFRLIGPSVRRCLENETWSGEAPICQG